MRIATSASTAGRPHSRPMSLAGARGLPAGSVHPVHGGIESRQPVARLCKSARASARSPGSTVMARRSPTELRVDRDALLSLCAALNVAQAMLDEASLREAAGHANAAVVAVHAEARWTKAELARMAEAQAWAIGALVRS